MKKSKKLHFDTLSIHAEAESNQHQALNPPIYMSSTFMFNDLQQADDTFSFKRKAYVYTRGGNPTINLLERRIAVLESGIDGVCFASGMAAITSVLLSLVKHGESILAHGNLYGSTYSTMTKLFPKFGIKTIFMDMTNIENVRRSITSDTKVIYFETPTNPSLAIIDISEIVKIAHKANIKVVVDNTLATPFLQKPLELGADIVLHSATKYISGHGDTLGGVAIAKNEDYLADLKFGYLCELGGVMSPFNAWLLLRGLKTLGLRVKRHQENAQAIAEFLYNHPKVEKVMYSGLPSHPGHDIAKKQMQGFGGVLSFELRGDDIMARKCVESVKLAKLAVSLGDAETLIEIPALMTHRAFSEEDLHKFGFSKKTIRISVGLENSEDLIEDLSEALNEGRK
jgi:methionine-gamma-lyase